MKVLISSLIALVFSVHSFGQESKMVELKDAESWTKLEDGVIKDEISTFAITGIMTTYDADSGPIHDIKPPLVIPLQSCSDNRITFERGNWVSAKLHVSIASEPFVAEKHQIGYDSTGTWAFSIDGSPIWGTDGNLPKNQIANVEYWFNIHQQFELPTEALEGLYEPNFCSSNYSSTKKQPLPEHYFASVYESADKKRVYIYMLNGDGAGGYEVTWVIEDHKYLMRVVDYGF